VEIRSKAEFYRLWTAGCLGNKPRTWSDVQDAIRARLKVYGIREMGKAGGGLFTFANGPVELAYKIRRWKREGRKWMIDSAAPNHLTELQGEVCRTTRGLEGYLAAHSHVGMREAIARRLLISRSPLETRILLHHFCDAASLDDIDTLLEMYPDATIEFCAYSVNVGNIPGRNTIIWEVRNY
jgi:hypothetical protein